MADHLYLGPLLSIRADVWFPAEMNFITNIVHHYIPGSGDVTFQPIWMWSP